MRYTPDCADMRILEGARATTSRSAIARREDIEEHISHEAEHDRHEQHAPQGPANAQPEHNERKRGEEDERHIAIVIAGRRPRT